MKEMLRTLRSAALIRIISRYGVLGERETVTVTNLPRRGVHSSVIGRTDIRTQPTPDLLTGLFVITARSKGKYKLQNTSTGIELSGVPRRSLRKILDWE